MLHSKYACNMGGAKKRGGGASKTVSLPEAVSPLPAGREYCKTQRKELYKSAAMCNKRVFNEKQCFWDAEKNYCYYLTEDLENIAAAETTADLAESVSEAMETLSEIIASPSAPVDPIEQVDASVHDIAEKVVEAVEGMPNVPADIMEAAHEYEHAKELVEKVAEALVVIPPNIAIPEMPVVMDVGNKTPKGRILCRDAEGQVVTKKAKCTDEKCTWSGKDKACLIRKQIQQAYEDALETKRAAEEAILIAAEVRTPEAAQAAVEAVAENEAAVEEAKKIAVDAADEAAHNILQKILTSVSIVIANKGLIPGTVQIGDDSFHILEFTEAMKNGSSNEKLNRALQSAACVKMGPVIGCVQDTDAAEFVAIYEDKFDLISKEDLKQLQAMYQSPEERSFQDLIDMWLEYKKARDTPQGEAIKASAEVEHAAAEAQIAIAELEEARQSGDEVLIIQAEEALQKASDDIEEAAEDAKRAAELANTEAARAAAEKAEEIQVRIIAAQAELAEGYLETKRARERVSPPRVSPVVGSPLRASPRVSPLERALSPRGSPLERVSPRVSPAARVSPVGSPLERALARVSPVEERFISPPARLSPAGSPLFEELAQRVSPVEEALQLVQEAARSSPPRVSPPKPKLSGEFNKDRWCSLLQQYRNENPDATLQEAMHEVGQQYRA